MLPNSAEALIEQVYVHTSPGLSTVGVASVPVFGPVTDGHLSSPTLMFVRSEVPVFDTW